ncbi:hypothetical protein H5410_042219 [Solanum commersonii]|uniref:Uncharacterized protein n=1 Tax=Solanum commersonii TaxID=4109 RepID=A0A9J5XU49_SOLCO|nr:hypothetical protein H5410_042219 [Solanum commersonii]
MKQTPEQANYYFLLIFVCYSSWIFDLSYAATLSRREGWPIFKVKQAPEHANPNFLLHFVCYSPWICGDLECQNFSRMSVKTLVMDQFVPTGKSAHFEGQTSSKVGKPPFFADFPTLVIEAVGPDGQTHPFSGSNEPQKQTSIFLFYNPWIFGDLEFWRVFCRNFSWTSVNSLVMDPVGLNRQANSFTRSNDPQSRQTLTFIDFPLVLKGKLAHFKGQTSPRAGKPPFFFANFRHSYVNFATKNSWTSVKTLAIEPVGPNEKLAHFQSQTIPRASKPIFCQFSFVIVREFLVIQNFDTFVVEPVDPDEQTNPFSRFLVIQNSNVISFENFHGPLRPYLWS